MNNTIGRQDEHLQLKPKQKEIIDLLVRFRYLTIQQIQILVNHKSKERIRLWLNDLVDNHVLFRFFEKKFGSKPSAYCLDYGSIGYLKSFDSNNASTHWVYFEKNHSDNFRTHCMFLCNLYLSLRSLAMRNNTELLFMTQTELKKYPKLIQLHPDAFFYITDQDDKKYPYFLEVFETRMIRLLCRRFYKYLNYYNSHHWQRRTESPFPVVIFVCPDAYIKKRIHTFIQKQLKVDSPSFYLTTKKDMQDSGLCGEVLDKVKRE